MQTQVVRISCLLLSAALQLIKCRVHGQQALRSQLRVGAWVRVGGGVDKGDGCGCLCLRAVVHNEVYCLLVVKAHTI